MTVAWPTSTATSRVGAGGLYSNNKRTSGFSPGFSCNEIMLMNTVEFELNVPSGQFVVGNDFRDDFRVIGKYNLNTLEPVLRNWRLT